MTLKPSPYLLPCLLALLLAVTGCSKQDAATPAASAPAAAAAPAPAPGGKRAVSIDTITAEAKGFTAGAMMSANTAYIFFDPQCPHCGHLWQSSLPLQNKVKFVWIPIAFLAQVSAPQGAALLSAANPVQAMTDHEQSLLARQGGIVATNVPSELLDAVRKNTLLLNDFGVDTVPYIVAKNARTGQLGTRSGALDTAPLAEFLGLAP